MNEQAHNEYMHHADERTAFFQRFQHSDLRYAKEPDKTRYMKHIWNTWNTPPKPAHAGAASLLARMKGRK